MQKIKDLRSNANSKEFKGLENNSSWLFLAAQAVITHSLLLRPLKVSTGLTETSGSSHDAAKKKEASEVTR